MKYTFTFDNMADAQMFVDRVNDAIDESGIVKSPQVLIIELIDDEYIVKFSGHGFPTAQFYMAYGIYYRWVNTNIM